jgi:glycosyltransferase involved in cell wall biosynthesis
MGVNGRIWRQIGGFDDVLFGRGYGEENDWCQRAIAAGHRNVLVPNLFVYHAHGGSFGAAQKAELQKRSAHALSERWPAYDSTVAEFIAMDPWRTIRFAAFMSLCLAGERRPLVILDHCLGGGASFYSQRLLTDALSEGRSALRLTWDESRDGIDVRAAIGTVSCEGHMHGWGGLQRFDQLLAECEFVYNDMVGWRQPLEVLRGLADSNANLVLLFHDFFAVCPSYTLMGHDNKFCGVPENLGVCDNCLPRNNHAAMRHQSIREWRAAWQLILDSAREVRFFSESSAKIAQRAFSIDPQKVRIVPHAPLANFNGRRVRLPQTGKLVIGVIGSLNLAKGAGIVREMATTLMVQRPNARIVVIGHIVPQYREIMPNNVMIHGSYDREQLPNLLEKYCVRICALPSIVPETFSYVTQELMQLEMPLACFNIGAPVERIGRYRLGKVVQTATAEAMLLGIFELEASMLAKSN